MIHFITLARTAILAGLVSGCVALSAPALAADDALPQAPLSVRGVDFTSSQAVAHLKHRLVRIATGICMPNDDGHLQTSPDRQKCYDTAIRNGLMQIDSREQQAMRDRIVRLADAQATADAVN